MTLGLSRFLAVGAVFPAILGGCNDPAQPTGFDTVVHLDPRLADGRTSAEVLADVHPVLSADLPYAAGDPGATPWRLERARVLDHRPGGGVRVEPEPADGTQGQALRLVHPGPFDGERVDVVELDLTLRRDARARLSWRRAGAAEDDRHEQWIQATGADGRRTIAFETGLVPEWRGDVVDLWIEPSWSEPQPVDLFEVRTLGTGFEMGHEPLEPAGDDLERPGDGGLVPVGRVAFRSWPSDFGVPLFQRVFVPDDALFTAHVAVPRATTHKEFAARFVVETREGAGVWREAAALRVQEGDAWHVLRADLSEVAGREVELRLSALPEGTAPDARGSPERARVLWGEPLLLGSVRRPVHPGRPSVLLITLDTLRADHVGDPKETPAIAALMERGVTFANAWSVCNATTPGHASILTGLYVTEHGAIDNRTTLGPSITTLAELFRSAGYQTAAAVSAEHIQAGQGFGQGFDRFLLASGGSLEDGRETLEPLLRWIEEWGADGERPLFLWLHLFDPHTPYGGPQAWRDGEAAGSTGTVPPAATDPPNLPVFEERPPPTELAWLEGVTNHEHVVHLYRAGVRYTDELLKGLFAALDAAGATRNLAVVLTSDHGEALGEHDIWYSHAGLYPETLRVPLVLTLPGGPAGVRVREPVSTIDIAPTLVELCGLEPVHGGRDGRGENLLAIARAGAGDPARRVWFHHAHLVQVGLREPRHHLVTTTKKGVVFGLERRTLLDGSTRWVDRAHPEGAVYLWDPQEDPGCERELSAERAGDAARLLSELEAWRDGLDERAPLRRSTTAEEEARLRALGYAGEDGSR